MAIGIAEQVRLLVEILPNEEQERVLDYARSLAYAHLPPGAPGSAVLDFVGAFPPETVAAMEAAHAESEQVSDDAD